MKKTNSLVTLQLPTTLENKNNSASAGGISAVVPTPKSVRASMSRMSNMVRSHKPTPPAPTRSEGAQGSTSEGIQGDIRKQNRLVRGETRQGNSGSPRGGSVRPTPAMMPAKKQPQPAPTVNSPVTHGRTNNSSHKNAGTHKNTSQHKSAGSAKHHKGYTGKKGRVFTTVGKNGQKQEVMTGRTKEGQVSYTKGQVKKHFTHMSPAEKEHVYATLNNIKKFSYAPHVTDKREHDELSFKDEQIVSVLRNRDDCNIIEYNQTPLKNGRISHRILVRSYKKYSVLMDGKVQDCNICFVMDVHKNQIRTVYWNRANDNHKTINQSRYTPDLPFGF